MATGNFIDLPPSGGGSSAGSATAANQVLEIAQLTDINSNTSAIEGDTSLISGATYQSIIAGGVNIGHNDRNMQVGGIYKDAPPTLLDGDQSELILDENGNLRVSGSMSILGEVALDPATIAAIAPLSVVSALLPQVTVDNGLSIPGPSAQILLTGGYDASNDEFRVFNFQEDKLLTVDSLTSSLASSINNKTPSLGTAATTASTPVNLSNGVVSSQILVAPAINTNLLTGVVSTSDWFDMQSFSTASISFISTTAVGTILFEQTNDNTSTTGAALPAVVATANNSANITGISLTTTMQIVRFTTACRYVRARVSVAATGTVRTFLNTKQLVDPTYNTFINGGTVSSVTTVSTVNTVASVTSSQTAIPVIITDQAAAAITTTTTSATITPTNGISYLVNVPVTVVSGTNPTLDFRIQESRDNGVNWYTVYDFPRITGIGNYLSPVLMLTGNRIRYVQTISGTTPSFTRAITRLQSSSINNNINQLFDRTIDLNTLNSVTPALMISNSQSAQLVVSIGTATGAPAIQLEGSDDNGVSYYSIGSPLTAVASSTVQVSISGINSQMIRAKVSTAGSSAVPNYILLKGY